MKLKTSLLRSALAFAAVMALAVPARAQTTSYAYDQQYTGTCDGHLTLGVVGDTAGQSFTPTASQMNTVVFNVLVGTNAADPIGQFAMTVAAQLLAGDGLGGSVLAQSADVQIASGQQNAGPHVFTFPATVALTPGTKYTVALTVRSVQGAFTYINVQAEDSDVYDGGQGYSSKGPVGTIDFYFQEGIAYPATVTTVHSFAGGDGSFPVAALIQANDNNLYGTASGGGANDDGTVFELSTDGTTFQTLHVFDVDTDGAYPSGALLQASDGNLYSSTEGGAGGAYNAGTLFELSTDGTTFGTLHAFSTGSDGYYPFAGLIQGNDGYLYGIADSGGTGFGGTVFKVSTDGTTFQTLHAFSDASSTEPQFPEAGLIQASDGFLYGTTSFGGANGDGTVFKVSTDGTTFQVLHEFSVSDGADPDAALLQASDGNLYGTTEGGAFNGTDTGTDGTVFMISRDGTTFQTLHTFTGADGSYPQAGLLQASDGNLYGTTDAGGAKDDGTAFMVSTDGTTFATLYGFGSVSGDGVNPMAGLIQASDGNLYGTTITGGANNDGEVFEAAVSLPDVVQFHMAINSVNETAGTASVRVDLIGVHTGQVSIGYVFIDGTAKAGTDYSDPNSATDELTWVAGDTTPKFIPVTILNRQLTDGSLRTLMVNMNFLATHSPDTFSLGHPSTATLTINGSIPGAPVITSAATATGIEGQPFSYQITASATPTSYGFQGDPNGLTIDPKTGLISGTPKAAHGPLSYMLNAYNAAGKGSQTLTITFSQAKPTITSLLTADATANAPFSYQITASGGAPQRFGVTGLPAGLSVDPATGILSGTRKVPGPVTMTLNAFNSAGEGSASLTVNVAAEAVPSITSATTASATAGQPFTYTITASNNPTSFGVQSLPAGLSVDATTGVISGTRKVPGTVTLTLNAYNSTGKGSTTLMLTVSAP